jgi:hypothetical protein
MFRAVVRYAAKVGPDRPASILCPADPPLRLQQSESPSGRYGAFGPYPDIGFGTTIDEHSVGSTAYALWFCTISRLYAKRAAV